MNNLINMSDHEKVIFVTGIDESKNTEFLPGGIKSLASEYPFAIFFTSDDRASETFNYPVMNIWKGGLVGGKIQGVRLTRFTGIDEENNTLQIGDHTIKLLFDYESGRIGLYDANKLESLQLISISYINLNGTSYSQGYYGEPVLINAKDNKFVLTFKFESTHDGDASKISNNLTIADDVNDFVLLSKNKILSSISESINGGSIINNEYNYQITKDTYKDNDEIVNSKTYNFISQYSTDKNDTVNLSLILNPVSYILSYNSSLLGSIITQIGNGELAKIDVNFEPSNVTTYSTRNLNLKIYSDNSDYVDICNADGTHNNTFPITNGESTFYIKTSENVINNNASANLTFEIWYTLNGNDYKYDYLTSTRTVILSAVYVDTFWYAGYKDPREDSFDINNLLIFNSENVGRQFLYDWKNNEFGIPEEEPSTPSKFFIAIPNNYKDIIKPRWDSFYYENNEQVYTDCISWFNTSRKRINNIDFIIYESKFNGKFYGKIK